ncbi:MAG: hypothetical protein QOH03_2721, partial [Kribbellaceae bacterium]|nr:hypothetical protein [Kribbellaceae bacterium]
LEELRVETRLRRIDLESTLGRHTASIAELRELGLRYPLREGIRSRLMTALYRGGQQADALAAYREFRTTLVDGTGIEPSPDLRAVHQAMLAGDSELSLPSAQLSSVPAPIRDADEGFGLFQLPAIPADLVGRDTPMERLRVLARPGQRVRPIVVWGAAGIGTSTLALAVAHELRPNFGDGQLYVDVASWRARNRSDSAEELAWHILGELLITCGVAPAFLPRQLAGRSALFRARIADHKVLLVIDGASEPEQVVPLLPGTASCLVLVTSRQPLLGLVGASRLRLEAMSRSEATQLVSAIAGRSVLAARSAQVREIVTRSAGIPAELRRAVRPLVLQELASVDDQANSSALSQEVTTLPRAKA